MARLSFIPSVWLVCILQLCSVQASQIVLTGSTAVIKDGLTDTLTLKCSLEYSPAEGVDGEEGSTGTNHDIIRVSSIIVSKADQVNGEVIVAKIISSGDPQKNSDFESLVVSGGLNPDNVAAAQYLELTWPRPGEEQSGRYICEVYTIDSVGRSVAFKTAQTIGFQPPDLQELITEMNLMKDMITNINDVLKTLKAPHYETGQINCEGSASWPKRVSVQFQTPYDTPPMIYLTVLHADINGDRNTRYAVGKSDITTSGFVITCSTWADSILYGLTVGWVASVA